MLIARVPAKELGNRLNPLLFEPGLRRWMQQLGPSAKCISDLAEILPGYAFPSTDFSDEGVPVVRITDIGSAQLFLEDAVRWNREAPPQFLIDDECVLLAMTGSIGKVGYKPPGIRIWVNQRVACLRARDSHDTAYLAAFLLSDRVAQQFVAACGGSVPLNLGSPDLAECVAFAPSPAVQHYIGDRIREAERLRRESERLVAAAKRLVEGLIAGTVSESEVKAAQDALAAGDPTADEAILRSVVERGAD